MNTNKHECRTVRRSRLAAGGSALMICDAFGADGKNFLPATVRVHSWLFSSGIFIDLNL